MTQQHTPGPWTAEIDESEIGDGIVTARDGDLTVCQIHDHGDTSEQHTHGEALANARLIAAAPDMLEACQEALACIMKHVPATEFAPRDMLRAAIARARGE